MPATPQTDLYFVEAREMLAKALHERAPATAEAIGDITEFLSPYEGAAVASLATLLAIVDVGGLAHVEP